jgi:dolichol-phosphate mannosyltransferase
MSDSIVIIPTYNEIENMEKMVRKVMSLPFPIDLLVVDDNSPDGTAQLVEQLMKEFPERLHLLKRAGKNGLGTAYIAGFRWVLEQPQYQYIFEMDCDFSHNPDDLIRLKASCENGADLTVGSRYVSGVNVINWPMRRVLLSYFASKYVQFITGMTINDATAGFKCYRRKVLETIQLDKIRFVGYAFQIEMKFKAWINGFKLAEVPIVFTDRTEGTSKMHGGIIKEAAFGVLQLKIRSWFSKN